MLAALILLAAAAPVSELTRPYRYGCLDTKVVLPTDWSVIENQGFPCCTLITCTPVGIANRRMVVRFSLESVEPLDEPPPDAPPSDA